MVEQIPINILTVNGHGSDEFGIQIQYPYAPVHPQYDISGVAVPARSGDLLTSNLRYPNFTQTFNFTSKKPAKFHTWSELSYSIEEWLACTDYENISLSSMFPWCWQGFLNEPIKLTPESDDTATGVISFACKPFLKREDEMDWQPVPSKMPITNEEIFAAQPLWHIVGSGDFTLTVNGTDYQLTGIDGEVYIDSERFLVYKSLKESRAGNARFTNHDFPELKPGDNTVQLTGSYTKFEYKPNWRRLA